MIIYSDYHIQVHSPRSPKGIICLMQISTGETNYLVDTFKLRENLQLLQLLNEVFCNPMIVKVCKTWFHFKI